MGVRDLGAIVKKHAPSAVTLHPTLASFAGRRVAIDANLLTVKFHFVKSYREEHKHVRAWYTFLNALKRESISPIIVFDGETRVPQKEKENLRRTNLKEEQRQRGEAEGSRGDRLREVQDVWGSVAKDDKEAVAKALHLATRATIRDEETATEVPKPHLEVPLQRLIQLHDAFHEDATNPVYSRNQALITKEESAFFHLIMSEQPDSSVFDLERELKQVISKSDALGLSHRTRALGVPKSAFTESMALVQALGLPFIRPSTGNPHEAEGLCSTLYSLGLVDFVISEDTDVAVYGAPLLRRVTTSQSAPDASSSTHGKTRTPMNVLDPKVLVEELGLTRKQFVDFALLCGTDFTDRIPFLGPAKALEHIRTHGSIETILTAQSKYQPHNVEEYLQSVREARDIFLSPPPLPSDAKLEPSRPDRNLGSLLRSWGIWYGGKPDDVKMEELEAEEQEVAFDEEGVGPDESSAAKDVLSGYDAEAEKKKDQELVDLLDRYL